MNNEIDKKKFETPALLTRLKMPAIYYDKKSHHYWAREKGGGWTSLTERAVIDILKSAGLSADPGDDPLSEIAVELLRIRHECGLDFAGPLSGHKRGHYKINGRQILVTRSYEIIKPRQGSCETIYAVLEGLFGEKQAFIFLYWLKLAYEALASSKLRPGQALFIAGPRNSGKSFLQNHIITPVLGGRACRCYRYLSDKSDFNGELWEAEHLMIDDDVPPGSYKERMALGSRIKSIVASELHAAHYKFQDAFSALPFWRLTGTVNDNIDSLGVLPPIDETLEDKIILLKAESCPMPMPTETPDQREAFRNQIYTEIPALIFDLTRLEIPAEMVGARFGLQHFHHPAIIEALQSLTPEERLLGLIDAVIFHEAMLVDTAIVHAPDEWAGTAAALESTLIRSNYAHEAEKLLSWNNACGTYLGHLAKRHPERVKYKKTNSSRSWIITKPNREEEDLYQK